MEDRGGVEPHGRNGATVKTPFVTASFTGWVGLASVGLLIFFGIQGLGVYAVWQLAVAQRDANSHATTALEIVQRQARDWQSVLSQTSLEHRDLVEAIQGLAFVNARSPAERSRLAIEPPPVLRQWQRGRTPPRYDEHQEKP